MSDELFDIGLQAVSLTADLPDPIITVSGANSYTVDNTADYHILGLSIHGKSTQGYASYGGTPVGKNLVDPSKIVIGGFNYDTGAEFNNSARARTGYIAVTPAYLVGSVPDGYSIISIYHYTTAKEFLGVGGVSLLNGQNGFIRLLFKRNDNAAITDDDLNALKNSAIVTNGESTDYEPYMGTPNPECPVPIGSVGDSGAVEITACGKNLLKPLVGATSQGITCVVENNSHVIINGTAKTGWSNITEANGTGIVLGKKYTLSVNKALPFHVGIRLLDDGEERYIIPSGKTSATFEPKSHSKSILIYLSGLTSGAEYNENFYVQLELGETATDYEPYKGSTASITTALPLCGIPVDSGGNYTDNSGQQWVCDELIYNADGTGKVVKYTEKISSYNGETITTPYMSTTGELTEGATVIYQCAEPQEIELTAAEMTKLKELQSYDSVTNIYNNSGADMTVKILRRDYDMQYIFWIEESQTWVCPIGGKWKIICVGGGASGGQQYGTGAILYGGGGTTSFGSVLAADGGTAEDRASTSAVSGQCGYDGLTYGWAPSANIIGAGANSQAHGYGAGGAATSLTLSVTGPSGSQSTKTASGLCGKIKSTIVDLAESQSIICTIGDGGVLNITDSELKSYLMAANTSITAVATKATEFNAAAGKGKKGLIIAQYLGY